jgi:hypothetical protein
MAEIWKVVKGFSNYEISDSGKVRNKDTKKHLAIFENGQGKVPSVCLRSSSGKRNISIARLVGEHFLLKSRSKSFTKVVHNDGNTHNNKAKNLKWGTLKEAVRITRGLI